MPSHRTAYECAAFYCYPISDRDRNDTIDIGGFVPAHPITASHGMLGTMDDTIRDKFACIAPRREVMYSAVLNTLFSRSMLRSCIANEPSQDYLYAANTFLSNPSAKTNGATISEL